MNIEKNPDLNRMKNRKVLFSKRSVFALTHISLDYSTVMLSAVNHNFVLYYWYKSLHDTKLNYYTHKNVLKYQESFV